MSTQPQESGDDPSQSEKYGSSRLGLIAILSGTVAAISAVVAALLQGLMADLQLPARLTSELAVSVAAILVSLIGVSMTFSALRSRLRPRLNRANGQAPPAEATVEVRIEEASRALQVTAGLVRELEAEMKARMAALERLRAENDEFEKLAALRREEAEAVSRLIESVISNTHSKLGRSSRRDQVLFFVAGLAASIPVQVLVNVLS